MFEESAEKLFHEDISAKQKERSSQRARTGNKGSSRSRKGVRTPYDFMTAAEKKTLNGKVTITSMYDLLLSKEEFEQYPKEKQTEVLTHWRGKYSNHEIMNALEVKSQGTFASLLQKLDIPKKRSWTRSGKTKQQPKKEVKTIESPAAAAHVEPIEKIERMESITILDGLDLKYNGVYNSDQLSRILTKLQLITDGEENNFIVSISLQEKKD